MTKERSKFSIQERRNWGFWDGVSARERRRLPDWNKISVYRCRHPFDRPYGEAFWVGWYDEPHPNTGKLAESHPDRP